MKTKIKSVTVATEQETWCYMVGDKYNGLLLYKIEDKSMEFSDSLETIYMGFTADNEIVFEAINVPVVVDYERV